MWWMESRRQEEQEGLQHNAPEDLLFHVKDVSLQTTEYTAENWADALVWSLFMASFVFHNTETLLHPRTEKSDVLMFEKQNEVLYFHHIKDVHVWMF